MSTTVRTRSIVATITCLSLFSACVTQVSADAHRETDTPELFYVASVELKTTTESSKFETAAEPLTSDVASVLRHGRRVAFQPPDECLNSTAAPEGAETQEYIRMKCGVLMASLERVTAKSGYEVVSWQGLKHESKPPLEMARELQVEVLFEVNQLTANVRQPGVSSYTGLTFYKQRTSDDREPVEVAPHVAKRCKDQVDSDNYSVPQERSATLDLKAVDVRTGRTVWYYQNTILDDPPGPDGHHEETFFRGSVEAVKEYSEFGPGPGGEFELVRSELGPGERGVRTTAPPSRRPMWSGNVERATDRRDRDYNGNQLFGVSALVGGGLMGVWGGVVMGQAISDSEGPFRLQVGDGIGLATLGLTSMIVGAVVLVRGNQKARNHNLVGQLPPERDASPEAVLCVLPPVVSPFAQREGPQPPPRQTAHSKYDFADSRKPTRQEEETERQRLFTVVATDFTVRLSGLVRATPTPVAAK